MKRRRRSIRGLSTASISNTLTGQVLPGVLGGVAANYLDKLPGLDQKPQYVNYAAVGGGLLLAVMTKNKMLQAAGIGMAIVGGKKVADDLLDGQGVMHGLLPSPAPQYRIGQAPPIMVK
ncbi:MAG: hypothetical protein R3A50_04795 [Saprospiraceae bacterium]